MGDLEQRQRVEGFAELISQPGIAPLAGRGLGPDFRGPSEAAATREWWRAQQPDEPDLVWLTAPAPATADTLFTFVGESANLPEHLYPPNQATLYADDAPVITFDLGQRTRRRWVAGDWALEFLPKQVHTTVDGHHRQFGAGGCSGLYHLAAPARAIQAGRPLQLKVALQPARSDAITWFAVRRRTDALEVSPQTNAEQITQLQQEVIHLKRIVGALARRGYADLLPERLPTQDVLIYANGRAHVHPPDLLRLQNGDLLVCFREASEHISADGKIVTVRSTDGGRSWGERQVVRMHEATDEREASIAQLRDGTLLMDQWVNPYYDRLGRYAWPAAPTNPGRQGGLYLARSTDNGHTWVWDERPLDSAPFDAIGTSERIVELPSGRLLMAVYFWQERGNDHYACAVFCSDDRGLTWRYLSTMGDVAGVSLDEPALVETRSGRLIGLMRNETGPAYYQAVSDDEGRTWSDALPTPIPGARNPASLVALPDGTILCVYGSREDPSGIYVVASYDEGASWDMAHRRVIRDDFPNLDIGYPSTVLLSDGRVLTAYYFNMFDRFFIVGSAFAWERP